MKGEFREQPANDQNWRRLYRIGAIAAIVALAGTLTDIVLTMLPGWEVSTVPTAIDQWFIQFQTNPLLGLRNLDLLNVLISVVSIPLYVALYGAHRRTSQGYAALALVLFTIGTAVFLANNAALPMVELTRRFSSAAPAAAQLTLYAAGTALLAKGAHGSMGAFPGFFLSSIGTFVMAFAMLKGRVFSRPTAYVGMAGIALLTIYIAGITFLPSTGPLLMAVALPGGLLMIAWNVMVATQLFKFSSHTDD